MLHDAAVMPEPSKPDNAFLRQIVKGLRFIALLPLYVCDTVLIGRFVAHFFEYSIELRQRLKPNSESDFAYPARSTFSRSLISQLRLASRSFGRRPAR